VVILRDFAKIDLRITRITKAKNVEKFDKPLRLELDLGGETRQVLAVMKSAINLKILK
jgi:methionyl-tRNA synthetase